jgi:hypothetical protein
LSKVADGKEQPDMLMKTSFRRLTTSYTEEEKKLFAEATSERNKLDTTNIVERPC